MICNMCRWNLDRSYKFKLQCKKADEALRDYPLSGVLPRPFPPIPNDPPMEIGSKRPAESRLQHDGAKKARSDSENQRDTRERRETRERERERERQNEKKDKPSDHHDLYEEEDQDGGSEAEQEESNSAKEERKLEPGEIRVHACDQCERTFPLRQALALHIQRAHRDRNYKCTECDRHFFTKYDLSKHMTTHSEEKPFSCSICQKQFSRLNLLQRHEKVHRDEARYACQHCDREFFTTEELEKHEDAMHKKDKPFQCNICNKRFQYKQGLERHEMLHSEDKTFVCDYCKEAFHTSTKLARHLSSHAGHRPFMCKLCPRTFLLSHHLTRHMRTHSVEKRHVCEDCGKAFKRKESLEVHQLTHTKRTGMGLTCDVCQESCRNRADYVTHIKQHIEAGEKMGPDGLQPDNKNKSLELDSDEEEEEEDQYSDGDDDYTPPAYIAKKIPKALPRPSESEEEEEEDDREDKEEKSERQEKEERKEHQVVYVRSKDGNMVKKTIKTLMPIQRRDIQEQKTVKPSAPTGPVSQTTLKTSSASQIKDDNVKSNRVDETEAQVQKIVASVFKEHKIPLKHQANAGQDQSKDSSSPVTRSQSASQETHKDNDKTETTVSSTPKAVNTVKVIKRFVLRKPAGSSNEGTPVSASGAKDGDASISGTPGSHKVKRVIVRRIIRQGDTTREVIMNPDGTAIDPAELAKLPTGNVVKRVVVKRPFDKGQSLVQAVLQSAEQRQKAADTGILNEKFELKTSTSPSSGAAKSSVAPQKTPVVPPAQDQETKEKLEQLEKRVEQQRLKIEELQARKAQQDYEVIDEMLPERHDESEDEQQLPLKRVFVKRKQSIYDEEREYNDDETEATKGNPTQGAKDNAEQESGKDEEKATEETLENVQKEIQTASKTTTTITTSNSCTATTNSTPSSKRGPTISSTKVYSNKRYMIVKSGEASEVEEMSRELCSILETSDTVVKMQETMLSDLTQMSGITAPSASDISTPSVPAKLKTVNSSMEVDEHVDQDCAMDCEVADIKQETAMEVEVAQEKIKLDPETDEPAQVTVTQEEAPPDGATLSLDTQDLSEATAIFESSDDVVLEVRKSTSDNLTDSVIELSQSNDTINLNDTNDSQDSLEDKLSQMEG